MWSRSALRTLLVQSRAEPGARFVLPTIALHVDDGGVAFPSVGTLSELTGISERQIRRHLRQLEAGGELSTKGSEGRYCNKYRITMSSSRTRPPEPGQGDRVEPGHGDRDGARATRTSASANPVICDRQPGHGDTQKRRVKRREGLTLTSPDGDAPTRQKPRRKSGRGSRTLPQGETLTDERRQMALKCGLAADRIEPVWAKFADHEFAQPRRRWDQAWRNWCRREVEIARKSGPGSRAPEPVYPDLGEEVARQLRGEPR